MEKIKERRFNAARYEIRAEGEGSSRHVEGYASVFDSPSIDMGYREIISKGAFDGVIMVSDVLALLNHDERRGVLARSRRGEGSLKLEVDENGLKYSFDAPNTALGEELLESLRRGDISESSFAFTVQDERWEKQADGTYIRYIDKIDHLYDVSPVYSPAYEATTCDLRGLEVAKQLDAQEVQKKAAEAISTENKKYEYLKNF